MPHPCWTGDQAGSHDRLLPREIVSELDRFIVGQDDAKRAVAIALRNRWRRQQLDDKLREEVLPKNILMIGPTGVGKTEISRRLAKLAGAPFLKVEATKFTEVGYVGRDVEQIVRDLVEVAIAQTREQTAQGRAGHAPQLAAEERVLDALVGATASAATQGMPSASKLRAGELDDKEIEIEVQSGAAAACRCSRFPACRARRWARSRSATFSASCGGRTKTRRMTVEESHEILITEESDKLLDQDAAGAGGDQGGREQRHRVPRRDRQDLRARRPHGRRRVARGRAARSAAADRGHHRLDQARPGEDRPHPVHRVGRLPRRQAVRPAAGIAGPPADPRRAEGADARRFPPHPDRAGSLADQAVRGAAEDRRRDARLHRRRDRRHRRHRGGGEFDASRISARAACRR